MQVILGHENVPTDLRGAALAIGNFDGVHRGHQVLLRCAIENARRHGGPAGAMVFEPHPRELFDPDKSHFRLTTLAQKITLMRRLGLDLVVVAGFDAAMAAMEPEQFIDRVLVDGLGVRHVVVGYDFAFGRRRAGTAATLEVAGRGRGFTVQVIAPVADGQAAFSSTAVRRLLAEGDVRAAAGALGHWWRIAGKVVGGAGRGTGLGFPTANVAIAPGTALAHGIYAARVYAGEQSYVAGAYLGTRPTFDNGLPVLEVFLLDFDGNLYGREIEVELIERIRGDRKFDSVDALKAQMAEDCSHAGAIIAALAARPAADRLPLEP